MLVLDIVVLQWASPGEYFQILVEHYSLDYLVRGFAPVKIHALDFSL